MKYARCVYVCVCVFNVVVRDIVLFCFFFNLSSMSTPRLLSSNTGEARDIDQIDPVGNGEFQLSAFQQGLNQEDSH